MGTRPPILVISLRRSEERREHMARQLSGHGLDWEFVDALDGDALTDADVRAQAGPGAFAIHPMLRRRLTRGEIGCALSHLRCYQIILDRRRPRAFVLEDDVELSEDFVTLARSASEFPVRWDLVLFAHHSARHRPAVGAETCWRGTVVHPGYRVARVAEFPMGAMAYLVTRRAAERLHRFGTPLRMPADWLTGYAPSAGVRLFAVTPPVVTPHAALAAVTTLPGRDECVPAPASSPRTPWFGRARSLAGSAWLQVRKAGVVPGAYTRRP